MSLTASPTTDVSIPWGCWYNEQQLQLVFPASYDVQFNDIENAVGLSSDEIADAITSPIESPSLPELVNSARSAVIAIDDISRPTPTAEILPVIIREISALPDDRITIIVALGAHRPLIRAELEQKIGGDLLSRFSVEQHHPYENLVDRGHSSRGTPVRLNRTFCEADVKISVGGVLPHPYMGYGGGAKIVVPGLAGIETLRANHQPAVTGITGGLCDTDAEARRDIEEIALAAGLNFSCNAVVGRRRRIVGLFCGHPVAAHRTAVRACRALYSTNAAAAPYDVAVLNAYPKDTELLQAGNTLNCYRSSKQPLVKEGGTIVITAACSTGLGYHSLHGKGMPLYRTPGAKPFLKGRDLIVFSPNLGRRDFDVSFWNEYRFARTWAEVIDCLRAKHGARASVGVFPMAPMQIVD